MEISAIKINGELLKDAIAKHFSSPGGAYLLESGQSLAKIPPDYDGWLDITVNSCYQQKIVEWAKKQWICLEFNEGMTAYVYENAKINNLTDGQDDKFHFTVEYKNPSHYQ